MWNVADYPMALYGALTALVVFAIFLGSWWRYAARVDNARAKLRTGEAVLLHVDRRGAVDPAHVADGHHIPIEELDRRANELGPPGGRTIIVCAHEALRTARATRTLKKLGYDVVEMAHAA